MRCAVTRRFGLVAFGQFFRHWPTAFELRRGPNDAAIEAKLPYVLGGFDGKGYVRVLAPGADLRRALIFPLISTDLDGVKRALSQTRAASEISIVSPAWSKMPPHTDPDVAKYLAKKAQDEGLSAILIASRQLDTTNASNAARDHATWHKQTAEYILQCDPNSLDEDEESIFF